MANISEISIKRPVLSTVMTIILLLFGMIGYKFLGVREFPSVDNPLISVNVTYPGANAEVIMNQITEPLEQNINGIPGIRSLSSVSSQGSCRITVEFELSVDLETAANDVRDKVSRAQRYLPRDCDPSDHSEREWRGHLGTETLLHAPVAGPDQNGRLRNYSVGCEERSGRRKRRASIRKH